MAAWAEPAATAPSPGDEDGSLAKAPRPGEEDCIAAKPRPGDEASLCARRRLRRSASLSLSSPSMNPGGITLVPAEVDEAARSAASPMRTGFPVRQGRARGAGGARATLSRISLPHARDRPGAGVGSGALGAWASRPPWPTRPTDGAPPARDCAPAEMTTMGVLSLPVDGTDRCPAASSPLPRPLPTKASSSSSLSATVASLQPCSRTGVAPSAAVTPSGS
mmetsp:Transcript_19640/g.75412  ORF Transcript_19640/g.75412 Transcript_19640/m.75412 type:complete len:221 (+) Transcript_19640:441-1103(+)